MSQPIVRSDNRYRLAFHADEVVARPWVALLLIDDLLDPLNQAMAVRTCPVRREPSLPFGSMADIPAIKANAGLIAAMTPLLPWLRSLFGATLQITRPPSTINTLLTAGGEIREYSFGG